MIFLFRKLHRLQITARNELTENFNQCTQENKRNILMRTILFVRILKTYFNRRFNGFASAVDYYYISPVQQRRVSPHKRVAICSKSKMFRKVFVPIAAILWRKTMCFAPFLNPFHSLAFFLCMSMKSGQRFMALLKWARLTLFRYDK